MERTFYDNEIWFSILEFLIMVDKKKSNYLSRAIQSPQGETLSIFNHYQKPIKNTSITHGHSISISYQILYKNWLKTD